MWRKFTQIYLIRRRSRTTVPRDRWFRSTDAWYRVGPADRPRGTARSRRPATRDPAAKLHMHMHIARFDTVSILFCTVSTLFRSRFRTLDPQYRCLNNAKQYWYSKKMWNRAAPARAFRGTAPRPHACSTGPCRSRGAPASQPLPHTRSAGCIASAQLPCGTGSIPHLHFTRPCLPYRSR